VVNNSRNSIDAHQHYWDMTKTFRYEPYPEFLGVITYGWKQAGLDSLDRSFLPQDLEPEMAAVGCTHSVLINALNVPGETDWMLGLADRHDSIAGVVGWLDLTQPIDKIRARLDAMRQNPKLVGIRHLSQFEPDDDWLIRPDVVAGLGVLAQSDVPYDLLVNPVQLARVPKLSEKRPDLNMVIDHLAKPYIKRGDLEPWSRDMRAAAQNPRLYCKLSGMSTEADLQNWKKDDLVPYVSVVLDAFGIERVMYGSDWPVATLAGTYRQYYEALRYCLEKCLGTVSDAVQQAIYHDNAAKFYGLKV
jgi:L-fuconolactonase